MPNRVSQCASAFMVFKKYCICTLCPGEAIPYELRRELLNLVAKIGSWLSTVQCVPTEYILKRTYPSLHVGNLFKGGPESQERQTRMGLGSVTARNAAPMMMRSCNASWCRCRPASTLVNKRRSGCLTVPWTTVPSKRHYDGDSSGGVGAPRTTQLGSGRQWQQQVRSKKTTTTISLADLPQGPIRSLLPESSPSPSPVQEEQQQDEAAAPAYPTVVMQARRNMARFDNCVLLTRVGGFYELYFEHAEEYGPLLNLKVASKKTNAGPVPMVCLFVYYFSCIPEMANGR